MFLDQTQDLLALQQLGGWKDQHMRQHYAKIRSQRAEHAMRKAEKRLHLVQSRSKKTSKLGERGDKRGQIQEQCIKCMSLLVVVAPTGANATSFSSTKIQMISSIQYLPLVKQESFLRAKYEVEGLSVNQIAALTFSSRSTIVKYLERFSIPFRSEDRQAGVLPFGKKWRQRRIVLNAQEQVAIEKAKRLRDQGLSYEKIAAVMNAVGIKTRSSGSKWYAKTVRDIILRANP